MILEDDEAYEINLSRLAIRLGKLPSEILDEPIEYIDVLVAVMKGEEEVREFKRGKTGE